MTKSYALAAAAVLTSFAMAGSAWACSGCGCTLNTDELQAAPISGWLVDERVDYINQSRLQIGGKTAPTQDPGSVEVQKNTTTIFYTTSIDYQAQGPWGVNLAVPMQYRTHTTFNNGDWEPSKSAWNQISDLRLVGRYTGLVDDRSFGLELGAKMPTGSTTELFKSGTTDQIVDRGLQPGTGTWDALVGAFKSGKVSNDLDWFGAVRWQKPLNAHNDFAEGQKLTGSLGLRYHVSERVVPQLQVNIQNRWRDKGSNADIPNSGGEVVNLSPGLFYNVQPQTSLYGFVQLPVYQRAGGLELVPEYTASVGVRHHF